MNKYSKELILWVLIVLPYVYLATIWSELPATVPTHFNLDGQPNDWSSKYTLLFMPAAFGIGIYLLMLLIPILDPKKQIQNMGDKFYKFRLLLTVFISLLMIYLVHLAKVGSLKDPTILLAGIGALFAIAGNYFQTIRPNYFIGIRTPWTLQNEHVWKTTHVLSGRLWMAGGSLLILLSFIIKNNYALTVTFFICVGLMTVIPVAFSYIEFRKLKVNS